MNTKREYIRHGRGKSFEIECLLRMVSGALTTLGISILRTLEGGE